MPTATSTEQRDQLSEQRRKVDFDSYDVTVDELLRRVRNRRIDVAPVYQRQFRWEPPRQSRLVESVLLGIPVPPLFMALNATAGAQENWEVVDGLQRLLTLVSFAGDDDARTAARLTQPKLRLADMEKLTTLEGCQFVDLAEDLRTGFENCPFKVIVLNDKSDRQVRFDLFERLNTGGVSLTAQEIRECVFRGPFMDLLGVLSCTETFLTVIKLTEKQKRDGTPEEFVLRFFAFLDRYEAFDHAVLDFLNDYAETSSDSSPEELDRRRGEFEHVFGFLSACFPRGITTRTNRTPVNLFEAVAVGAALALKEDAALAIPDDLEWVHSEEMHRVTSGGTNSRAMVRGRIELGRDRFLGR